MPNVIHFEICVDDLEAAARFYSKVFDWKIDRADDSDYWYITTGPEDDPGISGGLVNRFNALNPTINTIEVPSLDEFARKVTSAGGKVLAPKMAIADIGYVQYCEDPEGNAFGIMEFADSAE
jgi:predicted enzyme related to lactoylglutathione lyase